MAPPTGFARRWWDALRARVLEWLGPGQPGGGWTWGSSEFPAATPATYWALFRTQPEVRTVVEFLADNLAQLGVHVYRRVSDTDRQRIAGHPLAELLTRPNGATTRYRLIRDAVCDVGIYAHAYWLKLGTDGDGVQELLRLPPGEVTPQGDLVPTGYLWQWPDGRRILLAPAEVVHFRLYEGLSPLETLRRLLAEQTASRTYYEAFWRNAAKLSGWIKRPKEAPRWTQEQREKFVGEIARYKSGGDLAGGNPVLEDGMEFMPTTATAHDSQLVEARKLTREEVAAAYHVPPAMIGIVEAQGYGSLREQHKALYQDTLGPWKAMLEDDLELQLLRDFSDSEDVYVEFNIAAKLSGSFEEQAAALNQAVGSPWMTRNEARARVNLPRIDDADFDIPITRLDTVEGQAAKLAPREPVETEG